MIRGQVNAYREAILPIHLHTPSAQIVPLDAVVDTGFSDYLSIPPALVSSLHLAYYGTADYELGDGALVTFRIYTATVDWDGQQINVPVLASDGGILIGMRLLYGYQLFVDVIDGGEVRVERRP
jgi:clan AA aspartic protease